MKINARNKDRCDALSPRGVVRAGRALGALLLVVVGTSVAPSTELVLGQSEPEGTQPRQWRVIWREDPAHEATISWNTRKAAKVNRLYYRTADEKPQVVAAQRNGKYAGKPALYYHHVTMNDLKPATRYEIVMESDGQRSAVLFFWTAPATDVPLALVVGGDSRSDREARRQVNQLIAKKFRQYPRLIAFGHGGDFVGSGRSLEQWSHWMTDHELTTTDTGRLLPIVPVLGNHDEGPLFNQIFNFPRRHKNYYVTQLSSHVCLITLNSNMATAGVQATWLKRQLATLRPQYRWLIVQYHRPAFPAVKDPGTALRDWVPLFEQYHVDLVCEFDGHVIKRTMPIRGGKPDPTGVVYVGEGGLGVPQRTPKMDRWYLQAPGKAGSGHHVQLLGFGRKRLDYQAVLLDGSVFDSHSLQPRQSL